MKEVFTLAHISDPHVGPLPQPQLSELLNKRILGYLSWKRRRHKIHRPEVLAALKQDLSLQAPDHLAVTGDLTNISLPAEFTAAANWLEELGSPEEITVVPGNHDAYVSLDWAQTWGKWAAYMSSDKGLPMAAHEDFDHFPSLRFRGPLALIGLSSANPTPWGFASGRLGSNQLDKLSELLDETHQKGFCRVVLLHHPPTDRSQPRKRLTDAAQLRDVLHTHGAELVLHGHEHHHQEVTLESRRGDVPVVGAASASAATSRGRHPAAQYLLFKIVKSSDSWNITMTKRAFDPQHGRFSETDSLEL